MKNKLKILMLCDHNDPRYLTLFKKLLDQGHRVERSTISNMKDIWSFDFMVCFSRWDENKTKLGIISIAMDEGVRIVSPEYMNAEIESGMLIESQLGENAKPLWMQKVDRFVDDMNKKLAPFFTNGMKKIQSGEHLSK